MDVSVSTKRGNGIGSTEDRRRYRPDTDHLSIIGMMTCTEAAILECTWKKNRSCQKKMHKSQALRTENDVSDKPEVELISIRISCSSCTHELKCRKPISSNDKLKSPEVVRVFRGLQLTKKSHSIEVICVQKIKYGQKWRSHKKCSIFTEI